MRARQGCNEAVCVSMRIDVPSGDRVIDVYKRQYQYIVSGTKATLKGTVSYSGAGDCAQTWIVKGIVYCGDAGNGDGEVFKYPAGGSAIAVLGSGLPEPLGVTAAEK